MKTKSSSQSLPTMEGVEKHKILPDGEDSRLPDGQVGGAKRPAALTVICIIGILWSLMNFIMVFSPFIKKISDWAPAIYGVIVAVQFISFIGIWHMKRWGVHLYIAAFFAKQIFSVCIDDMGIAEMTGMTFSVIFMIFFLIYYRSMDKEL